MPALPFHRRITETVLSEHGMLPRAIAIAAAANAQVDVRHGNPAWATNLHALRGFVEGKLQSEDNARHAVNRLLEEARRAIVDAIVNKAHRDALARLGAALHTVQDGVIHRFKPWTHPHICGAGHFDRGLMNGPGDSLCRSRSWVADNAPVELGAWGVAAELGCAAPAKTDMRDDDVARPGGLPQASGLLTLCWGASPGRTASVGGWTALSGRLGSSSGAAAVHSDRTLEWLLSSGRSREAAKKSHDYVNDVKRAAGAAWFDLVRSLR